MSKEIIRPGNGIKIKYNNTCTLCQCEYTYEEEDVYSDYSFTGVAWVNCPCCGAKNNAAILPPIRHIPSIPTWFDNDKSWRTTLMEEQYNEQD